MNRENDSTNSEFLPNDSLVEKNQQLEEENLNIIMDDIDVETPKGEQIVEGLKHLLDSDVRLKIITTTLASFLVLSMSSSQVFSKKSHPTPIVSSPVGGENIVSSISNDFPKYIDKHFTLPSEFKESEEPTESSSKNIEASDLSLKIIDSKNPISAEYIEKEILPNLVLVKDVLPNVSIRNEKILVNKECVEDLRAMLYDASQDKIQISIRSIFRAFEEQEVVYTQTSDKTAVTLPGHSQHHTGLAIDFTSLEVNNALGISVEFWNTKAGKWLNQNAWKYGFVLSYTNNHDGVANEDWHYYYLGKDLSQIWYERRAKGDDIDLFDIQEEYGYLLNH